MKNPVVINVKGFDRSRLHDAVAISKCCGVLKRLSRTVRTVSEMSRCESITEVFAKAQVCVTTAYQNDRFALQLAMGIVQDYLLPKIVANVVPWCPIYPRPGSMKVIYPRSPGAPSFSLKKAKNALLYFSFRSVLILSKLKTPRVNAGSKVPPKVKVSL